MRPRPLHSRSDLVAIIRDIAPTRACQRAVDEGRTEVLGGFTPPGGLPYYLVHVTAQFGSEWLLSIEIDEDRREFRPRRLDSVAWECWDGRSEGRSLKDGDHPRRYADRRRQALENTNGRPPETTQDQ